MVFPIDAFDKWYIAQCATNVWIFGLEMKKSSGTDLRFHIFIENNVNTAAD